MADATIAVNDENFESLVLKSSAPVLVDFWAPWCGPCLAVAPTLEAIAEAYNGKVTIAKLNVDDNKHVPYEYGVRSIPYLALFHNGQVVDSVVGAVPKAKITAMLDKALG